MLWLAVGVYALRQGKTAAAWTVFASAVLGIVWQLVFFEGSRLTEGWETDSPANVAASYKPWGFIVSNLFPAFYLAVKQPNPISTRPPSAAGEKRR